MDENSPTHGISSFSSSSSSSFPVFNAGASQQSDAAAAAALPLASSLAAPTTAAAATTEQQQQQPPSSSLPPPLPFSINTAEIPGTLPALVAPREVFHRVPFRMLLFIQAGGPLDLGEVTRAVMQGTLSTKCFKEGETEATCVTSLQFCPRCQTDRLVEIIGVQGTIGPFSVADGAMYCFCFDQCRSYCSSSRLHLHTSIVVGLAVSAFGPCVVYSSPIDLKSKVVRKAGLSPSPKPRIQQAPAPAPVPILTTTATQQQPSSSAQHLPEISLPFFQQQQQQVAPEQMIVPLALPAAEQTKMLPSVTELLRQHAFSSTPSPPPRMHLLASIFDNDGDTVDPQPKRPKIYS